MDEYIKKEDAIEAVTSLFRVSALFSGMNDDEKEWREKAEKVLAKCEVVTDTADTPQTDTPKIRKRNDKPFRAVWLDDDHNEIGTPQRETSTNAEKIQLTDEPQTEEHCETCRHKDECEGATYEYKNTEWWCLAYAPIDEPQTDCSWK